MPRPPWLTLRSRPTSYWLNNARFRNTNNAYVCRLPFWGPALAKGCDQMKRKMFSGENTGYLFILPAVLTVGFVMLVPLLYTIFMSFQKLDIYTNTTKFVQLKQYASLFRDQNFFLAVKNTFVWTAGSVFFQLLIGFVLANIINMKTIRLKSQIRILLMVPWVLPSIVSALVWQWSYHADFGIINEILKQIGILDKSVSWLSSIKTALPAAILVNVWKMVPFVILMTEAALQGVSVEVKEAATVDGANSWQTFRNVTIPQIRPTINTVILLLSIWTMNAFTFIYILTEGGPAHHSEILSLYIYQSAFLKYNYGQASAASVILFALTGFIALFYNRYIIGGDEQ